MAKTVSDEKYKGARDNDYRRCSTVADVYKFKVRLCELENVIWREIEITSVSSVAKLGYAVISCI